MAAVWNGVTYGAGKMPRSNEKIDRELRRLRFEVKQYDAQLKKLQRELALKNSELKNLKSCGACTCLGDRRRGEKKFEAAAVRDLGTFGTRRNVASRAFVEVHGHETASSTDGAAAEERRLGADVDRQPATLRRSVTEFFQNGVHASDAATSTVLAQRERELARLHEELAQLRSENYSLKEEVKRGAQQRTVKENENVKILQELSKQVRELENELLKLREERYRLLSESEQLRNDANSKETNLLRCENKLTKAEREKTDLAEQVRHLEERERRLTTEIEEYRKLAASAKAAAGTKGGVDTPSRLARWNSDLALNRDGLVGDADARLRAGERRKVAAQSRPVMRDCNPYCEVCRLYRSKLVKHSYAQQEQQEKDVVLEKAVTDSHGLRVCKDYCTCMANTGKTVQEMALRLDEQEKQDRLLRRYMNENQDYERLLADKDREIAKLKAMARDVDREYSSFRKSLLEQESNRLLLQRDLSTTKAIKEKTEHARVVIIDEYNKLQQQYQNVLQDKGAMQRELQLCVEEQDKQKRQIHRHLDEIQAYEKLAAEKDREIGKLKGTIRDLEHDYEAFRRNLLEQEANLLQLQRDLSTANASKEKMEQGRVVLADDYKRLQQQYQKLHQDKAAMQRELELCIEEQDKQKRLLQRYLDEIQSYERLLAEKEKERMDMLLQFQTSAERLCKCASGTSRN